MKKRKKPGDETVQIGSEGTGEEGQEGLEKGKPYLKAMLRFLYFSLAGGLCFRYPVVLPFTVLFLIYALLAE